MNTRMTAPGLCLVAGTFILATTPLYAQDGDTAFYRGKTVTYVVTTAPGGGHDFYGRMDLPGVPHVYDYAKDEETRRVFDLVFGRHVIGRPLAAPPGVPQDRKVTLRAAFDATMKDPVFIADADSLKLDFAASDGAGVEALFAKFFSYPQAVIDRAIAAVRD